MPLTPPSAVPERRRPSRHGAGDPNGDPPTPELSENYENGLLGDGRENRDFDGHERDFDGREKQH